MTEIDHAIASRQFEAAAKTLESLSEQGQLSGEDEIALALILMWPPLAAWDESLSHLRKAVDSTAEFEATAWGAYICQELLPISDEFHCRLTRFAHRAEAPYLIAQKAIDDGDFIAASDWIHRAIAIDPFPNALRLASRLCSDLSESHSLLVAAMEKVEDRQLESSKDPTNRSELRQENWKSQIRGEWLTSHVFDAFYGSASQQKSDANLSE